MKSLTRTTLAIAPGALILVAVLLTRLHSYLLFHSIAELFSIVVAIAVFIYAWNARHIMRNNYLLVIGIAFLFYGILDLIHTLSYNGMGVFATYDSNLPTSLWVALRYLLAISFLIAPLLTGKVLKPWLILVLYFIVTTLLLFSIFYWHIFPLCYVEGSGLTPFKIISEYIICCIFILSAVVLCRKRSDFTPRVFWLMTSAVLVSVFSEVAFTRYIGVYSLANLLGHLLEVVAFYLIYEAVLFTGFRQPVEVLFRDLNKANEALRESNYALQKAGHDASKRMKELHAFYSLSEITEREGITLYELCQEMANVLPASWQYPDITCAVIVIGNRQFRTSNFKDSAWKQSTPIKLGGVIAGKIEIAYLEERPPEDDGPFLTLPSAKLLRKALLTPATGYPMCWRVFTTLSIHLTVIGNLPM
jgi:hypothetical protein